MVPVILSFNYNYKDHNSRNITALCEAVLCKFVVDNKLLHKTVLIADAPVLILVI